MANSLFFRYGVAIMFWVGALLLIGFYTKISLQLWREAIHRHYRLTLNRRLPVITGFMVGGAIVLGTFGLVALTSSAVRLLKEALVVALIVGILVGLNIYVRQRSMQRDVQQ